MLKELDVIITDLTEKIVIKKNLRRGKATSGLIGAIRLLQEEFDLKKNFNGYKNAAMKTLLLYEIRQYELVKKT